MVGPERAVHLGSTSELGVDHHVHALTVGRRKQREELIQRIVDVEPQAGVPLDSAGVGLALVLMSIETTGIGMDDSSAEVRADQVGGHGELSLERGRSRWNAGVGTAHGRSDIKRSLTEVRPVVGERAEASLGGHRVNGNGGAPVGVLGGVANTTATPGGNGQWVDSKST